MNKLSFILLAALASTGAVAAEVGAPNLPAENIQTVFESSIAEAGINNNLETINANQTGIYDYAEAVFEKLSATIEQAYLENLEQHYAIRVSSR